MGSWETPATDRCADCAARIPEAKVTKNRVTRSYYYIVGGRKICPACFVTKRVAPTVRKMRST